MIFFYLKKYTQLKIIQIIRTYFYKIKLTHIKNYNKIKGNSIENKFECVYYIYPE